jgi:hypothetical protein
LVLDAERHVATSEHRRTLDDRRYRLAIVDIASRLSAVDYRPSTTDYRLLTIDYRPSTTCNHPIRLPSTRPGSQT